MARSSGGAHLGQGRHPGLSPSVPSAPGFTPTGRVSVPSIPTMLSVHSEQLHKTGFPTVHAVVLLEGTMNLTGETQPLVEQLMMIKRMQVGPGSRRGASARLCHSGLCQRTAQCQRWGWSTCRTRPGTLTHPTLPQHIPTPLFVLEIWKACFVGLIESPEGTEELKWTAFTYLKVAGAVVRRCGACPVLSAGSSPLFP